MSGSAKIRNSHDEFTSMSFINFILTSNDEDPLLLQVYITLGID